MATITVRFYAGAARAAGVDERELDVSNIADLRRQLGEAPALGAVCAVSTFLVDGTPASDTTPLYDGAEVHVLPPFAGG